MLFYKGTLPREVEMAQQAEQARQGKIPEGCRPAGEHLVLSGDGKALVGCLPGAGPMLTLPGEVEEIGPYALAGSEVACLRFPLGLKWIGEGAFLNCRQLARMEPADEWAWGDGLDSGLWQLSLPPRLEELGPRAFAGCSSLKTAELPGSLEKVGEEAFSQSGLESLTLKNGVKEIGPRAFAGCRLGRVTFPRSLRLVGAEAFARGEVGETFGAPASLERWLGGRQTTPWRRR